MFEKRMLFNLQTLFENFNKKFDGSTPILNQSQDDTHMQMTDVRGKNLKISGVLGAQIQETQEIMGLDFLGKMDGLWGMDLLYLTKKN